MTEFNLKHGDLVYYPVASNSPIRVDEYDTYAIGRAYPINIPLHEKGEHSFTRDGKAYTCDKNPTIFPATQEWYEKLVRVYPNLEEPMPVKDIIKHLLDEGNAGVLCWVSDQDEFPNSDNSVTVITGITVDEYFISHLSDVWEHATPIMKIETFDARIVVAKTGN